MARPKTAGIEYFPFDVSFFHDIKVRRLLKAKGTEGIVVYSFLLCLIYKEGYFLRKNDDVAFISSEETGVTEEETLSIMDYCAKIGLFDTDLYNNEGILTSKGIQMRYENICKLCRRTSRITEYSCLPESTEPIELDLGEIEGLKEVLGDGVSSGLFGRNTEETIPPSGFTPHSNGSNNPQSRVSSEISGENPSSAVVSSENLGVSSEKGTQSKVNKSKVNKTKLNSNKTDISDNSYSSIPEEMNSNTTYSYSKEEKEKVFSFFFWENYMDPRKETEKFYNWNELREWKTRDGILDTEGKRILAAKLWSPESKDKRCTSHFLAVWKTLYDEIIKSNPEVAAKMLDERSHSELVGTTMSLYCTKEVYEYISRHNPTLWPLVADRFQGLKVQWRRI